jgi:2-oxoglutarate dehydrogenase E2 component (dihydrolipoamide succinyltransferase)
MFLKKSRPGLSIRQLPLIFKGEIMQVELKIPEVGESIQEAVLAQWYKSEGEYVEKDEPVYVIETDKVTLEVPCEASGILHILVEEGETVPIGQVVGTIDTQAAGEKIKSPPEPEKTSDVPKKSEEPKPKEAKPDAPKPAATFEKTDADIQQSSPVPDLQNQMPSVRRLVTEKGIDITKISGTGPGGRITKGDVLLYLESAPTDRVSRPAASESPESVDPECSADDESITRTPMTPIRKRIARHLLAAKQNTAMLTTFNEIDMSHVMDIRNQYKDSFYKTYQIRLGFMSFFIKATVAALKEFPDMNASIEGDDLIYHHYYHIGIAIGAEKGLVVPVIRHADKKSFAELEGAIMEFVDKIKTNKLALKDLEGGTFSITNGGVYGSLLSTPILNMPQSGILGMHKIEDRPIAVNNQVVIRPMMYVALSYDHRVVDGKAAVTCLRRIKEFMENPERIMMEI